MTGTQLKGKTAFISGGDSGIGQQVAILFAKEGCDMAIIYLKDKEGAEKTRSAVEKHGQKCLVIQCDISKEEDVERAYKEFRAEYKQVDILVNNASVEKRGKWEEYSIDQFNLITHTNILGNFLMTRVALRENLIPKKGRVIFTGSIQGLEGSPDDPAYSASKGALHAMTKSLSKYLVEKEIMVNCVAPGPVKTPMLMENSKKTLEEDGGDKYPLGVADPEEIAPAFLFFAASSGDTVTGEILKLTAGKVTAS